jgi:hypothetical protein
MSQHTKSRKTALWVVSSLAAWIAILGPGAPSIFALPAHDAQSAASVADAARKARNEKKEPTKTAKVYTNDDVVGLTGDISVVGIRPEAPPTPVKAADAAAPAQKPAAPQAAQKDEAYWRKAFAADRKTLADDSKELDVLQRELNLKQEQYYSNPNTALIQQNTRQDIDDSEKQIETKKQDVAKDTQAISDLEDQLQQSGGDPGWSREP